MTFPVVAASNTSFGNDDADNTLPVALPAGIAAGDRLVVIVASDSALTWPAGWNELFDDQFSHTGIAAAYRDADGSEGASVSVTGVSTPSWAAISYRITGADAGTPPEIGITPAQVSTASPNPPSVTPSWGAADTLWIAIGATDANSFTVSAYPTNYSSNQLKTGGEQGVAAATRNLNASSEDPGAFTFSVANFATAQTIAIRPALTLIEGTADITEADDTVSADADLEIQGSLTKTEADDTLSADASVQDQAQGSLAVTEGDDTSASSATLLISATAAIAEADDVPSTAGTVEIIASLAATEQDDALSSAATIGINATAAITEGDDTLSASAQVQVFYPRRGGADEREEFERKQREWRDDLRRIIDEAFLVAGGIIDPTTRQVIPPPDYSLIEQILAEQAKALDQQRIQQFVAAEEQLQEEEAIAILLLAA